MHAKNILTIGIDYRDVKGGVAAVENVYSSFYEPFNHITTVVAQGQVRKLLTLIKAIVLFIYWMLFHEEIKIVHVHGASDASFYRKRIFINIAKFFNKKVIFHCHGAEFKRFTTQHKQMVTSTLRKCDCIIALSQSWKDWFEDTFHHENVVIIKNVIPAPVIKKVDKDSRFTLLFLGRIGKRKGIYDLLYVLEKNKKEYDGKLLMLIGGDGETEKVTRFINDNHLAGLVNFEGWVSGEHKIRLLNKADAYVLPSYNEGLPISVLEAMSYSLPIISTNVGGIPEILKDGVNGYLIHPGNKNEIEASINNLMSDKDLRQKMGVASRNMVEEHLPEFVEKQLSNLYNNLLG